MKFTRIVASVAAVGVMFGASGCATILSGTTQSITVLSTPPGARVVLGNQVGITPTTFVVPKGMNLPIEIAQGPDVRFVPLRKITDPNVWWNLIPPMWPGFLIDAGNGAMTKYEPSVIVVDFRAMPAKTNAHLTRYLPEVWP